jgi:transcriptional regulator with XRE-family HTH domain
LPRTSRSAPAATHTSSAIKAARQRAGITQSELADRLGASPGYVGQLETGRTNPTVGQLATVAAALGCRLEIGLVPVEVEHPVEVPASQAALIRQ